jgi:hypothetical protein
MHLVYIDDSRDEELCVFVALLVPATQWRQCFEELRNFRRMLKQRHGIYVHVELHAWKFVSGRGRISPRVVSKRSRVSIFQDLLRLTAQLPGARLIAAVFPAKKEVRAFERLLNRINRTMEAWDSHAILIIDQGKEPIYTRLARRMHVYNPIPSRYGAWSDGSRTRNIPIDRILEDPFFKDSSRSYFIQVADFCAYALLRRERPIANKTKYGLDRAFALLQPILVREASSRDPEGIIRP